VSSEIIIDSFAGGGGASTGIEMALGRSPDIAINHDGVALAMHAVNHPATTHLAHNIWKVDPTEACGGRSVGLLWASPDCKHFSKAKGSKPVNKNIRDLAWVVVRWAKQVAPRIIVLENVEEFQDWGPVLEHGKPCPDRKGLHFRRFVKELRNLGYKVDWRELRAADYGSPTVRKRLFLIARRDGLPIIWPAPTHGAPANPGVAAGKLSPWRTAAEIIDWSLPCPSIFDTAAQIMEKYGLRAIRPLADNTLARCARGVWRYVLKAAKPFIVPVKSWGGGGNEPRSTEEPLRTVMASKRGEHAIVTPFVAPITHTGDARVHGVDEPLRTVTTAHRGEHALMTPFVTKFNKGVTGHRADEPLHTVTACHSDRHPAGGSTFGVVAPILAKAFHGDKQERPANEPVSTILTGGHEMLVTPFLAPRYNEKEGHEPRTRSAEEPAATITSHGNAPGMLIAPTLIQTGYGERPGQAPRSLDLHKPLGTCVDGGKHGLVAGFLAQHNTDMVGHDARDPVSTIVQKGSTQAIVATYLAQHNGDGHTGHDAREPISTVTASGHQQAVVSAGLVNLKGADRRQSAPDHPSPTQTAGGWHIAEVRAFLIKYYGTEQDPQLGDPLHTATTKDRFGVVTVMIGGEPYMIVDIGMRMLTPRELFRAQGFPESYIIDRTADGTPITKTDQIRMCGNSVCPQVAAAIVKANYADVVVSDRGVPEFAFVAAE
jgi:DNA (cytosine-5)-methyltransferase 1